MDRHKRERSSRSLGLSKDLPRQPSPDAPEGSPEESPERSLEADGSGSDGAAGTEDRKKKKVGGCRVVWGVAHTHGLPYGSGLGLSRCLGPGECLHSFIHSYTW